jgi:hypothetical protein
LPERIDTLSGRGNITVRASYGAMRFEQTDSGVASKLERGMMRTDYEPTAKRQAEGSLKIMQGQGRKALEDLLQKLFKAANTEVTIKVE